MLIQVLWANFHCVYSKCILSSHVQKEGHIGNMSEKLVSATK